MHYDYHDSLSDEESLQESQAWFKDVEMKYLRDVKAARAWLRDKRVTLPVRDTSHHCNENEIPKLEIDVFHGDPLHYQTFIAVFKEAVERKVADGQGKLARLLQYTGGPAKSAIKNCALIGGDTGYSQALDILQRRFGNPHLISQSIVNNLTKGPAVMKSVDARHLSDELTLAFEALKKLDMMSEIDSERDKGNSSTLFKLHPPHMEEIRA